MKRAQQSSSQQQRAPAAAKQAQHQKSQSLGNVAVQPGQAPGIFKMYMGSVKQLKKSSNKVMALHKKPAHEQLSAHPSHFISLNAESSANQQVHSQASLESLKKDTSLMQTRSSRIQLPMHGKAPTKLQLTAPPEARIDRSGTEVNSPNHNEDCVSRDQDNQKTESSF